MADLYRVNLNILIHSRANVFEIEGDSAIRDDENFGARQMFHFMDVIQGLKNSTLQDRPFAKMINSKYESHKRFVARLVDRRMKFA